MGFKRFRGLKVLIGLTGLTGFKGLGVCTMGTCRVEGLGFKCLGALCYMWVLIGLRA